MNHQFEYEGKTFAIREKISEDRYAVSVFLNNEQVSPEYSATLEVGGDFFSQHQQHIIDQLVRIAEEDVCSGIYFRAK
ncbi:hypothetical protein [Nitrosomonas sp. Nm34]|uniref:hypothetical protein n=1 Tax=Nitrosomonas sp. Nm34 TaxID=1881055 RepID=UPI0008F34E0D|nr:hypothetical protein [Nitrosomonas sp. Nm34]SFI96256.1 hypothetical protein SAMN05428978_10681 [Nitrosomonas sp. Nm34]